MRATIFATMVLTAALIACEGPTGPAGPIGEQGPQGERAAPHIVTATVGSDGTATAALPRGSLESPPALTCYVRGPGDRGWVVIATSRDHVCALVMRDGVLSAGVAGLALGWEVLFVAVY